jgi:hypothetical protein
MSGILSTQVMKNFMDDGDDFDANGQPDSALFVSPGVSFNFSIKFVKLPTFALTSRPAWPQSVMPSPTPPSAAFHNATHASIHHDLDGE